MIAETWLRVVTYRAERPDCAEAVEYIGSTVPRVLRSLERRPGFRTGHWGYEPGGTALAAVTHWASREAIDAAAGELAALNAERNAHGIAPESTANLRLFTTPQVWSQSDWGAITGRTAATWLRVALYRPEPATADTRRYMKASSELAVRVLRRQPGFRIAYWGEDPEAGTMAAVSYWDNRDAIDSAASVFRRLHRDRESHGVELVSIANLELFRAPLTAGSGLSLSNRQTT